MKTLCLLLLLAATLQAQTVLYSFTGGADGAYPDSQLTADVQGNLYGTTLAGGAYGWGTVYELTAVR
jgi:uncharacterized repeat protein (TIGR03803 family)